MTARQFERRFRFWQKLMLLGEWKITTKYGPLEHGEKADCDAKPEYREALIRFDHRKISADEVDAYCIHELVHCITWPIEQLAENSAADENSHATARFICETTATKLEEVILHVAVR